MSSLHAKALSVHTLLRRSHKRTLLLSEPNQFLSGLSLPVRVVVKHGDSEYKVHYNREEDHAEGQNDGSVLHSFQSKTDSKDLL